MSGGNQGIQDMARFDPSGPSHLKAVDWENVHHRRSVAASLVQGTYVIERDRQNKRQGPYALASRWWEFFHFQLVNQLVDKDDSCIFGAIYKYKPPKELKTVTEGAPKYVIAFRGTITKGDACSQDFILDLHILLNELHRTARFEMAMREVRNLVASCGTSSKIWIAGHSLGSAMAMLAGKNMAKTGILLEAFLFNPPFLSAPIESIKSKRVKHGVRIASSFITAGLTIAMTDHSQRQQADDLFKTLSRWIPYLFVHPDDLISSEYIRYFEDRKTMEDEGVGDVGRLATQNSIRSLILNACGKKSEPMHLLPSASLTVNQSRAACLKQAHGLEQWRCPKSHLQIKLYKY